LEHYRLVWELLELLCPVYQQLLFFFSQPHYTLGVLMIKGVLIAGLIGTFVMGFLIPIVHISNNENH